MFSVPACPEWAKVPGYKEQLCFCVKSCGHPVADCRSCGGKGLAAIVPIGVYYHYRNKLDLPVWNGDPRFDPRAGVDPEPRQPAKRQPRPPQGRPSGFIAVANWLDSLSLPARVAAILAVILFDAAFVAICVAIFR